MAEGRSADSREADFPGAVTCHLFRFHSAEAAADQGWSALPSTADATQWRPYLDTGGGVGRVAGCP